MSALCWYPVSMSFPSVNFLPYMSMPLLMTSYLIRIPSIQNYYNDLDKVSDCMSCDDV